MCATESNLVGFSPDGKLLASYGRVGHQLGEFYNLHFIGIDSKGNVYSAEVQGKRVQKFRNLGGL